MRIRPLSVAMIFALLCIAGPKAARSDEVKKDPPKKATVSGIYVDRKDNKGNTLTFLTDGEDEIQQYTLEGADNKTLQAMTRIFPNCRIRITYKQDGDVRHIIAVEKLAVPRTGVFTGEVMFVENNFWLAVKPKNGPPDAFALASDPRKGGPIVELLKTLKKGDVVAIRFTTDIERHRILQMEKKE